VKEKTERPHVVRLRVSQEELDWLRDYGERMDRPVSWVLRHALHKLANGSRKR
jgi:hypothetical protein